MREENPFLLDGGKGAEQGGCFHRSSGHSQCSKGGVVFLCSAPAPAQPLLWGSASSGLAEELWIVAVMLYFKNAAGSLDFVSCNLRFPARHS